MILVASLLLALATGVSAAYTNTTMAFTPDMDCTACIRAGFDYCINGSSKTLALDWNCSAHPVTPEYIMPSGGINNGYVCSGALKDQTNAIINGCRPYIEDADHRGPCGEYIVDLNSASFDTRIVKTWPTGASCTYRVISKCGYPVAVPNIKNPSFAGDYNVAYATLEGLDAAEEINGWEFETVMDSTGSGQSGDPSNAYVQLTDGFSKPKIADLNECK
jgi:hypothetical protein